MTWGDHVDIQALAHPVVGPPFIFQVHGECSRRQLILRLILKKPVCGLMVFFGHDMY